MQQNSPFIEEVIKSEYVAEPMINFHDMPSYNPEIIIETRLKQSIKESVKVEKCEQNEDSIRSLKHHSYYKLQAWLELIGQDLGQHKQIVKEVYRVLEKRIQISGRSTENLIVFLRKFVEHEKANANYLINKNQDLLKLFMDGKQSYYPKLSQTIEEIDRYDQGNAQKIGQLLDGIEKFIREKLETNMAMFEQGVKGHKEMYSKTFGSYSQSSGLVNKYRKKYQKLYNTMMTTQIKGRKDLYHVERKLVNTFIEAGRFQQNMGIMVQKLWDEVRKQELFRYEIVQSSLRMYLDKHVLLTSSKQQKLSSQEEIIYAYLNELNGAREIENSLNFCESLPTTTIKQLNRMLGTEQVSNEKLTYFLTKYPEIYLKVANSETHSLVRLKIEEAQVDNGTLLKTWKPCQLIVTVDNNLLISIDNHVYKKYDLERSELTQKTRDPLTAEIKEILPGLIFDTTNKIMLQLKEVDYDELFGFIFKLKK